MSSLLLVSYSHKIVDYKRKKEAKKEKVVIVAYLLIISNTNLKDTMDVFDQAEQTGHEIN